MIVAAVLMSGVWRPAVLPLGLGVTVSYRMRRATSPCWATAVPVLCRDAARIRIENAFTWVPIREVAILFAGIFVTIVPVLPP